MEPVASEIPYPAPFDEDGVLAFAVIRLVEHDPVNVFAQSCTVQAETIDAEAICSGDVEQARSC
jgi:hypothetical protein